MEPKREATIKIHFGPQGQRPTDEEIFNFFQRKQWSAAELSAMYRENYSVFVRFQSVILMRKALEKLGPQDIFTYADGKTVRVNICEASGAFKYVRIFGLPPEVEDSQIAEAMGTYGKIHQHTEKKIMVREQFAADTGFPIWNGVRGLLMEVMSDIPAKLRIQHVDSRIYYEGLKNKCFKCGESGHLKAGCPRKGETGKKISAAKIPGSSFAEVLIKGAVESQQMDLDQAAIGKASGVIDKTRVLEKEKQASQVNAQSIVNEIHGVNNQVSITKFKPEQLAIPPYKGKKRAEDYNSRSRSRSPIREAYTDDESW